MIVAFISLLQTSPIGDSTHLGTDDLNGYSASVLSSNLEVSQLTDIAARLTRKDSKMLDPEFFLASLAKGWKPRVVTVYKAGEVVGIMYTKERVISGVPTGVVYADGSLDDIFFGDPLHRLNAFQFAVQTLLASGRVRGVRMRMRRGSRELAAVRQLISLNPPLDVHYSRIKYNDSRIWKYHAHLPLPDSYGQFLKNLGSTTRHNFRYYRRRFEESGHHFIESLSMDELRCAVLELAPKSKFTDRLSQIQIEVGMNMVAGARRPVAVGLRHHNGEWLSVSGGWYSPGGAVLLFQYNNDRNFGPDSLSLVLRAFLIESLIRQDLEELVIWGDTGPPLSRYVRHHPTICVHFDVSTYRWRVARFFISRLGPWLPKRLAYAAQWVVPLLLLTLGGCRSLYILL